ncbi:hypothetical protein GQF01_27060 [Paenibacillus sp. 5J-6]|uniref:Flagellar protein FliT n=1 Tax=Paenibacillus silvestris TaxID=2606219 RepID=A0A6L8V8T5_9BACL|nr:hypothetical protein [Paenibacillus silvestris]MZQ85769.1 hypothetical protein [Paenibacillus silvestris]
MELIENLFQQLINKSEDLLRIFKTPPLPEDFNEVDHLFASRDELLEQLEQHLQRTAEVKQFTHIYNAWQTIELELRTIVQNTMQELDLKVKAAKNLHSQAQTNSNKYDSYLKQMPYGAFLDKKR